MRDEISDLRRRIDHIDDQLLVLLGSRMAIAVELAEAKGNARQDIERESAIIERLQTINASEVLDDSAINAIWNCIFQESRRAQAE